MFVGFFSQVLLIFTTTVYISFFLTYWKKKHVSHWSNPVGTVQRLHVSVASVLEAWRRRTLNIFMINKHSLLLEEESFNVGM